MARCLVFLSVCVVLGCGRDVGPTPSPVGKITMDAFSQRIYRVGATWIVARLTVADSTTAGTTWSSSDTNVVSISGGVASAKNAGTSTLAATVQGATDTVNVTVIRPFEIATFLQVQSLTPGWTVSGFSSAGWIAGATIPDVTQPNAGYRAKDGVVTTLDCVPRDMNDEGAVVCQKDTSATVIRLDGSSTDVSQSMHVPFAMNDSGDVAMFCYLGCSTVLIRRASGAVVTKTVSGWSVRTAYSIAGFSNARDVGLSIGAGYSSAHVYASASDLVVAVPAGWGRWSYVTAMSGNGDAVGFIEGPAGSNAERAMLWELRNGSRTRIPIGTAQIDLSPYVVGVTAIPSDLNDSGEVVGYATTVGTFLWFKAAGGGIVPLDSLIADTSFTVLNAAKILNDRRIAGVARKKSTGELWVVRLQPQP